MFCFSKRGILFLMFFICVRKVLYARLWAVTVNVLGSFQDSRFVRVSKVGTSCRTCIVFAMPTYVPVTNFIRFLKFYGLTVSKISI